MNSEKLHRDSGSAAFAEWSAIWVPKAGEEECGDLHMVKHIGDSILVGAVDGLGHGRPAAEASRKAIRIMDTFDDESIINLVERCHRELRGTRGVVMSLGVINQLKGTLTWIGVGNVEGLLLRSNPGERQNSENIIQRGGVVGYKLPSLQASVIPIEEGDLLVFTTDGIVNRYANDLESDTKPREVVGYIAQNYLKNTDDALVLAVRLNHG